MIVTELEPEPLLTCREIATRFHVSYETVRRWVQKGAIESCRVGPERAIRVRLSVAARHFVVVPGAPD